MSDLPTIVKLRYDLERWVNGRGGKVISKTVNVIDRNAEIVFEDAATGGGGIDVGICAARSPVGMSFI